jgi:hypothetical protein
MNCSVEKPCQECQNGRLMARMAVAMKELREDRELLLAAAKRVLSLNPINPTDEFDDLAAAIAQVERK